MNKKLVYGYINAENELDASVLKKAEAYEHMGADGLFIYNYSSDEKEKQDFLIVVRKLLSTVDLPLFIGYQVKCFEDVKKALYTGASKLVIPFRKQKDMALIKQITDRFGKDKVMLELDAGQVNTDEEFFKEDFYLTSRENGVAGFLVKHLDVNALSASVISAAGMPVYVRDSLIRNDIVSLLSLDNVCGVATDYYEKKDIMKIKEMLRENNLFVNLFESSITFDSLKKNESGLVPVIVQDYRTEKVLMLAYMNQEAFDATLRTGRMTYYSRSRNELWEKGLTSGHFQYLRELRCDCDSDTLLAKVKQLGAACHTGEYSCFYQPVAKQDYEDINLNTVFTEVFNLIADRKVNPKEGSYTNYLFNKGIDKILKKCGEEATEIVIAAKNPDKEEIKYEIADFLYHMMVLMVECGVDWDDIIKELAHRR